MAMSPIFYDIRELQRIFSRSPLHLESEGTWLPPLDIYETDREFIVKLEIPGVRKQDIKIGFSENVLTISGTRCDETMGGEMKYVQMEIAYGEFQRRVVFNTPIDQNAITAKYSEGFLKVVLPKL